MVNCTNHYIGQLFFIGAFQECQKDLFFGWRKCYVADSYDVIKCYKCSSFGHIEKNCRRKDYICAECGENHNTKDCQNDNKKCVNCLKHNEKYKMNMDTNHSSKDCKCSSYERILNKIKSNTSI